jgi:hypothetical protein
VAARLEGAMLLTRTYSGSRTFESAYHVHEFRRLLPKVGDDGKGAVQFWGPKKRRQQDADGAWTPWREPEHRDPDGLNTIGVSEIIKITDPKH